MKITKKIISIPPYISATWAQVASLYLEDAPAAQGKILVIMMQDDKRIDIPHLSESDLSLIFAAHAEAMEEEKESKEMIRGNIGSLFSGSGMPFLNEQVIGIPLRLGSGGSLEGLSAALQHNEAQSNLPDLPEDILTKIAGIARIVAGEESLSTLPKAEINCNCFHCQVARAIERGAGENEAVAEEEVTDEDLRFRLWDIAQSGEKLYKVTNPLDSDEQYSVYLGEPVGCTCGHSHCEHIKAVLNS